MGLNTRVAELGTRRVHVLVVQAPGNVLLRMRAEAFITSLGWVTAVSPADADVLLLCGRADPEGVTRFDRLWDQMVAPRIRLAVGSPAELPAALRAARLGLLDERIQRADVATRVTAGQDYQEDRSAQDPASEDGKTAAMPPHAPGSSDGGLVHSHSGQMADHGPMDMDMDMDMDMTGPAGIPLAHGDGDRDGLEMDVLHVPLGPVLAGWPADLVLHCTLHGDVVAAAEAEVLPPVGGVEHANRDERAAALVDAASRVLQLAGWEPVAAALANTRDGLLSAAPDRGRVARDLDRLTARVRRSRVLRWSLRGLGPVSGSVGAAASQDVHELTLGMLAHAAAAVAGSTSSETLSPLVVASGPELSAAVVGTDLAATRLIVAALTPWGAVSEFELVSGDRDG